MVSLGPRCRVVVIPAAGSRRRRGAVPGSGPGPSSCRDPEIIRWRLVAQGLYVTSGPAGRASNKAQCNISSTILGSGSRVHLYPWDMCIGTSDPARRSPRHEPRDKPRLAPQTRKPDLPEINMLDSVGTCLSHPFVQPVYPGT